MTLKSKIIFFKNHFSQMLQVQDVMHEREIIDTRQHEILEIKK